jgi:hypothetical protein
MPETADEAVNQGEYAHYLGLMMKEGRKFQFLIAFLEVTAAIGLMLHKFIPYTPVFPLLMALASLACLSMAVRARQFARILKEDAWYAAIFVFSSFGGGLVALMASAAATLETALRSHASIAPGGDRLILLNISWPTVIISAAAITLAAVLMRRIDWTPARRAPRHAGR